MTREEAIREIRQWDFINNDEMEALRTLIPELSESEEETTRKELLDFVRSFWADHKEKLPQASRWITYLEKQTEKNGEDEECTDFTIYHPLKNGKGKYECIPYSFYGSLTSFSKSKDLIDFLRTCFYTEEECNEWIEQQKNSSWKPSEEQMEELWNIISYIEKPDSNFLGVPVLLESLYEHLKKL